MSRVLVVEDQPAVARALTVLLEIHDVPVLAAASAPEALAVLEREDVGLVVQDMNFTPGETSGREGLELFRRIRELDPDLPVVVLTAWTSLETAVQMVKEGASDYVAKPWDDAKLVQTVRNLLRLRELQVENERLRSGLRREVQRLAQRHELCGVVYESAAMHRVVSVAVQVAPSDVPVLITGPSGAGKEKIAEIVQANSRRRAKPFVRVNAGAIPDELLESELFGAEPGAYTGAAAKRRVGRFEAADGGTIFLDEIGNLSAAGQMKLLRVLQGGVFERLGSSQTRTADVRVLAATNVDLRESIRAGRFREDLYFRLNVIELTVPPLHERPEDVPGLADAFARRMAVDAPPRPFSAAARAVLRDHPWPGNVRELQNRVQRALLVGPGPEITPADLGLPDERLSAPSNAPLGPEAEAEKHRLEEVLAESGHMVSRAASRLGLSRQALYRRMERLGISIERRART
jgi:DNA-binding NtrC family response regulator